jgi:predicted dinucleotide-binding enzyme
MRIGFIGAGHIGKAIAGHLVRLGHDVAISNSRGPETLTDVVAELGSLAQAVTTEEAIAFGDVLVVTIPLKAVADIPTAGTEGKTIIDTCNYYPERDGQFPSIDDGTHVESEVVQAHFAEANVVKAFNQIYFQHIVDGGKPAGDPTRRAIPIAGNSPAAKLEVEQIIDQIGFDPVDAGELPASKSFDNGGELYGAELTAAEIRAKLGV